MGNYEILDRIRSNFDNLAPVLRAKVIGPDLEVTVGNGKSDLAVGIGG